MSFTRARISDVFRERTHKGVPCYIVGGGPSLRDFDFTKLKDKFVIGINKAFLKITPSLLFSVDHKAYLHCTQYDAFNTLKCPKCWVTSHSILYPDDVYLCEESLKPFSESFRDGISTGRNSGYGAINLAYILGCSPIYLLGFDMKGQGKRQAWWHDGYPDVKQDTVYADFRFQFERNADEIKSRCNVINLNTDSELSVFPRLSWQEAHTVKARFVAFYTLGTPYEQEAEKLVDSIKKLNLKYTLYGVENQGNWQRNTQYKANVVQRALLDTPNDIVYVDADAVIQQEPVLFDQLEGDIAYHLKNGTELLSGTVFFRNNEKIKILVERWIASNKKYPDVWDQRTLDITIKESGDLNLKIDVLPPTYCQIFDSMKHAGTPVIEHFQASRRLKGAVKC